MTDFYGLLKQSIIDRGIRDADDREAVYAQARQAIVTQLWAFRPPLAADEIDTRVGAYDEAVERIERDVRAAFAAEVNPVREKSARSLPPAPDPDADEDIDAGEDEVAAPPLAEWRHDGEDVDEPDPHEDDDGPAFERGIPRAAASNGARRAAAGEPGADAAGAGSRRLAFRERSDWREAPDSSRADDDDESGAAHHGRWRDDDIETVRPWWRPTFNDREKVQILAGAISALAIALAVLGGYFYFSRDGGGSEAATVDVGVRREVSDAATAARIPTDPLEVLQSYSLFDGRDPTIFATTPDNPVRYVSEGGYARISSSASANGVKAIIGPGLADRLAGQRVRVILVGRSSTDFGAGAMRFAYQSGLAISHWQTANLAPDYAAVGMIWRVPAMRTDPAGDALLIEPGIPGDGTGVDIQAIKIEVLAPEGS